MRIFVLGLAVLGAVAGCGRQNPQTEATRYVVGTQAAPASQQVLHRGNGAEVQTLDPHRAEGVPSSNVLRDLFEGLTTEAPGGRIVPGTAASWQISADRRTYTFYLRSAARWSNGEPVTANDFVYGLQRSVDPRTGSAYAEMLYPIENARAIVAGEKPVQTLGVSAPDAHTVVIRLNEPTPYFLGMLAHSSAYPLNPRNVSEFGAAFARPGNLVSNGAFRLQEHIINGRMVLVKNPYYWDARKVRLQKVVYYPTSEPTAAFKRYLAGQLDWTSTVPSQLLDWVHRHIPAQYYTAPYLGTYFYGFNLMRPPFQGNAKLRRALTLVVDRKILTSRILKGGQVPAYSMVPPIPGYRQQVPAWAHWSRTKQLAEARRLYRAAGYSREHPLEVTLMYNTMEDHKRVAEVVAAMWQQALGVHATLYNQEWKVFLQTRKLRQDTEVFRDGWIGDYQDPNTFLQLFTSGFGLNYPGYANARYDALIRQAAGEGDNPDTRYRTLEAAERQLLEDQAVLPLYFYASQHLVKPYVAGWQSNLMNHHYSRSMYILEHREVAP